MTRLRWLALVFLTLFTLGSGGFAYPMPRRGAAVATPQAITPACDLAAAALSPLDLAAVGLDGFGMRESAMLTPDEQADLAARGLGIDAGVTGNALADAGFARGYRRQLALPQRPDGPSSRLRTFVETSFIAFATPEGAARWFTFLHQHQPADVVVDASLPALGEQAEITRFRSVLDTGEPYPALRLTVQHGALVAGVTLAQFGRHEPDQRTLEKLGSRLLAKIAACRAEPGLSTVALRLAGAETRSDEYARLDVETFPNYGESAETYRDRVTRYGDARDVYGVAQTLAEGGPDRGGETRYLLLLYRFADDGQADAWLRGGLDRAAGLPNAVSTTPVASAASIGDASLTLTTSIQRSGVGAVPGYLIYARVGATVAQVQILGMPEIPLAVVETAARAQVACLRIGSCPDRLTLHGLTPLPGTPPLASPMAANPAASTCAPPEATPEVAHVVPAATPAEQIDAVPASTRPPNFIVIVTDDLDARAVACMPNVQRLLAAEGLTFTQSFVTTPLCCPSRSSLLRGQYAHNHGVLDNSGPEGGFPAFYRRGNEQSTIATWLHDAGYRTALVGKYLNRYPKGAGTTYVPPGWDEWVAFAAGDDEDESSSYFDDYTLNVNGTLVSYGHQAEDYSTDVLAQKANDFVTGATASGQPFFLYLTPYAPHGPSTPAPRHSGAFAAARAPRVPSFDEADVSDKPAWVRAYPPLSGDQIALIDDRYRRRLRSLLAVDEMVAALMQTLADTGTLDSTYVIFTSDNGFHLGEHRLPLGKQTAYDESIRVPLIVRGPGVPAGTITDQIALNIDYAPTLAALAGVDVPDFVDGRSLAPLLRGEPVEAWRHGFLVERYDSKRAGSPLASPVPAIAINGERDGEAISPAAAPPYLALRTERYLFVAYASGERELYDLVADPYQLDNLVDTADPDLVAQLEADLATMRACAGDACRAVEDRLPE